MTVHTEALAALSQLLGDRLSRSKPDLETHGQNEGPFATTPPDAVAYPETPQEVADLVKICATHRCPVVGWGAGTSLEAHALALQGGVTVDFARMNRVLAVHPEDLDCVVQPGITREDLNHELRATGLFFPVDPGANATLGGMASTRASGTTAVRYGTMRDNVMGLQAVLADGRLIRTGGRARKSASGYDLTGLLVGAEGTLGLITELTLRLRGQPERIAAAVAAFPSVAAAVDTVIATVQMGIPMARIELVDPLTVHAFKLYAGTDLPEAPHLFIEFHGSEAGTSEDARRFGELAAENGAENFAWSTKTEERNALWKMRHDAAYAVKALQPGARMLVTDLCVPISRLAEAVEETAADIAEAGLLAPILGHVGDGNVHAVIIADPGTPGQWDTAKRLADRVAARALRLGGTITGEHGIGAGKLGHMEVEHGPAWSVMSDIKRALDPHNIMNPGKVVRLNA